MLQYKVLFFSNLVITLVLILQCSLHLQGGLCNDKLKSDSLLTWVFLLYEKVITQIMLPCEREKEDSVVSTWKGEG